jgi:hypothetical protein
VFDACGIFPGCVFSRGGDPPYPPRKTSTRGIFPCSGSSAEG